MSMIEVIAVERGHDGIDIREKGERFLVPEARLKDGSDWFVPVVEAPVEVPKPKDARPPGAGPVKGSKAKQNVPVADDGGF